MKSLISLFLLSFLFFQVNSANAAEIYGVDFDKIDWETICPQIEPIKVSNCEVVHPTATAARSFKTGLENVAGNNQTLDCEYLARAHKKLLDNPRKCKTKFKRTFSTLVVQGDGTAFTAEGFRDKYLSTGVINTNGVIEIRRAMGTK